MVLGLFLSILGCDKNADDNNHTLTPDQHGYGAYIVCEGGFNKGDAAICFFDKDHTLFNGDIFYFSNQYLIGDVLQSINLFNRKLYAVVNNSQKVMVCSPLTATYLAKIEGFKSPRYIMPSPDGHKAYVTNYYTNDLNVIDLNKNVISSSVKIGFWAEEMAIVDNFLFVCCVQSNKVYKINTTTDVVVDSISVGEQPQWIQKDKNGKLWVLCNYYKKSKPATLHLINPTTDQVENTFNFPSITNSPSKLRFNDSRDTFCFIDNDIYKMSINDLTLPTNPVYKNKYKKYIYGVGIEPKSGSIFFGDAVNFTSRGFVTRLKPDGTVIDSGKVTVAPSDFYFVGY